MDRREFIKTASAGAIALGMPSTSFAKKKVEKPGVIKNKLPRWRGFNLLPFFRPISYDGFDPWPIEGMNDYLKWIEDWGFDFVRVPMSYHYYIHHNWYGKNPVTPEEAISFNEEAIEPIEKFVYLAMEHHLHVSLCLHRAPGFCINKECIEEPYDLWTDEAAQQALCAHWDMWAKRFKDVSPKQLSFDLVNESYTKDFDTYRKIVADCLQAIRRYNPERIVISDSIFSSPISNIEDLDVAQSCRGYNPGKLTHFRNPWGGNIHDKVFPTWTKDDRQKLEKYYQPWVELKNRGIGVHCGECGCYNKTPHDVFLAWMTDVLDILKENDIGWALWNFRGSFGLIDSGRQDVDYKNFHGHKLDKELLKLLQSH